MQLEIIDWDNQSAAERAALLRRPARSDCEELAATVATIVDCVRRDGDSALREFTRNYDGCVPETLEVCPSEFVAAESELTPASIAALELAIDNVAQFHAAQLPDAIRLDTASGVCCEKIFQAIDSVGMYIPAGTAPLPSAAVMLGVPSRIAGCPVRIAVTPPRADGSADPSVLVAARLSGIQRVFKVGGAQAIAAMAFGTETVPKVCKIFGPGNAWVTTAKSMVGSMIDGAAIDMPAGPSELLVVADEHAEPRYVAADLLSQAEHGEDSHVILLSPSSFLLQSVRKELTIQLDALPRREIARHSLSACRLVNVGDLEAALAISNDYAPEHLILQTENARNLLANVRNAGSVFLGPWSPESAGDYCSGTNHVLPTFGHARTYSGLATEHFMRHMTVQELSRSGLAKIGPAIMELASLEGLHAHAEAVRCRLQGASQ